MTELSHPSHDLLIAFGQGRLGDIQSESVESHLTDCLECQQRVDDAPTDVIVSLVLAALPISHPNSTAATRTEYRSLTPFARGGLGEVLIARDTAVGREVAVKRLLPELGRKPERRKRFLREAAITGRLEHPGVAPVYGIGEDESGQPCYAMRFVPGKTLADAIRELHAAGSVTATSIRPLLTRFISLCGTVAYAHSRGVIHRDIKPSNVAVGDFGETILLDWGLALTGDDPVGEEHSAAEFQMQIADSDIHEQPGRAAITNPNSESNGAKHLSHAAPAYDRYQTATGTVLGTPGFMAPEQAGGMRVGPAADVYSLGVTLRSILTGKNAEKVASPFPALMAVAERATANHPAERYPGALAIAADVERWLADEPVSAYRDPFIDRMRRYVRRHQTASVATVVFLVAATVSLSVGAVLLGREQQKTTNALKSEKEQKANAVAKEAETASILGYVDKHVFTAGRPKGRDGGLGKDVKLAEAVANAANDIEKSFSGQPLTEARMRAMLGTTLLDLGDAKAAAQQFVIARQIFEEYRGTDDSDTLLSMMKLATAYRVLGRPKEALELDETVAERRKASLGLDHADTLRSLHNLANSYAAIGREEDALRLDKEVYKRRLATLGPDHKDTIMSMAGLASSLSQVKQYDEALKLREQVYARRLSMYGSDHADTIIALNNLANSYADVGRHEEALKKRIEVGTLMRNNSGPHHADTLMAMNNIARSYTALKQWPDALRIHREVLGLRRAHLAPDHPDTFISMYNIADTLLGMGRGDEAIKEFDEILRLVKGKPVNIRLVPTILERRLRHFAGRNDAAECRFTAEQWDKQVINTGEFLAHAAQLWSMTSAVQSKATTPDAARMSNEDADRAMVWLKKAITAGYKDRETLEKSADFEAIRRREDFKLLIAELVVPKTNR
jgi:serine/threonine protein kinase